MAAKSKHRSMPAMQQRILKRRHEDLYKDLDVTLIEDELYSDGVLTDDLLENVRAKPTRHEKASYLLMLLPQRGPNAFDFFHKSLKNTHLALYLMLNCELSASLGGSETFDCGKTLPLSYPTRRLQENLASNINKVRSRLKLWPWSQHTVQIHDVFTDVSCTKNVHTLAGIHKHSLQNYMQIFEPNDGKYPKRILAKGKAGTGKSTLIDKIVVDWARNVINEPKKVTKASMPQYLKTLFEYLMSQQFVIPLNLRSIEKDMTLADAISSQLPYLNIEEAKELCEHICDHESSVMFLFDGYDEYDVTISKEITDIIHNKSHLNCCLVLTTRPWKANEILNAEYIDSYIEVQGFSKSSVRLYVMQYFEDNSESGKRLLEEIEKQNLWSLASIPIVIQLMCILWRHEQRLPHTVTKLFTEIIKFIIKLHLSKEDTSDLYMDDKILVDYESVLLEIGELALEGLTHNELVFDFKLTKHRLSKAAWKLGLLAKIDENHSQDHLVEFPHKSIQEFLAAFYVAKSGSQTGMDILFQHCKTLENIYDFQIVIMFICGLNPERGNLLLDLSVKLSEESDNIKQDHDRPGPIQAGTFQPKSFPSVKKFSRFLMACMKEYQDKQQIRAPLQALSLHLTDDNAEILSHLFTVENNVNDIRLLCICSGREDDNLPVAEDLQNVETNSFPQTQLKFYKLCCNNVKKYISVLPSKLHSLCLSFIDCADGIVALSQQISFKDELKSLCVVEAGLLPHHISELINALTFLNIEFLNLSGNVIKDAASDIAEQLKFMDLKGITLIRAYLEQSHVKILCEALVKYCKNLEVLDFSRNRISDYFCELVSLLPKFQKLRRLKLQDCEIDSIGFLKLVDMLPNLSSLRELYLSWNNCDDTIERNLIEKSENFRYLKTVHMVSQNVSSETELAIENAVRNSAPNTSFHISPSLEMRRCCHILQKQSSGDSSMSRQSSEPCLEDVFDCTAVETRRSSFHDMRKRHMSDTEAYLLNSVSLSKEDHR